MRRRLIEALTYPRLFVLENMNLEDCPQDGRFDASCEQCRDCGLGQECHWMSCLNNFDDLARKPIHTIHASLLYSINLIEGHTDRLKHDAETCTCESCEWIRDAEELSLKFSNMFAWAFSTGRTTRHLP
jgi:hypothetical protein